MNLCRSLQTSSIVVTFRLGYTQIVLSDNLSHFEVTKNLLKTIPDIFLSVNMEKDKSRKSKSKSEVKGKVCEVVEVSKKPPMKTATDVISRLLWDESLPKRKFVVGYLDRFVGIVEKPFTTFDWSDPAVVDNCTLSVPKHRIQYFKYRNRKVWDKTTRMDIIFGSTGFQPGIYEFMQQVDSEKFRFTEEDLYKGEEEDDDDASSRYSDDEEPLHRAPDTSMRPNFFIAVRITDPEITANLCKVTDYIKLKDPLLAECCIPREMFHLTLAILKLDSPSEIVEATKVLHEVKARGLPPISLHLEALDIFHYRVLFSRVKNPEGIMKLRDLLVKELSDRNINITDRHSFVPHVTIAKISRPVSRIRHSGYIDQYLYLKFEDDDFGSQTVNTLALCEMGEGRREDGFYLCPAEINLV